MACDIANPKEGGKVDIWQETFPVRFGAIDRSDRLTLDAMFQFFQEAAISHAENLSVGREDMAKTGQVWILSRISVLVERRPVYGESITVRTWPRGGEKLFAIRDFDIRGADGSAAVSARSGWIIVDIEKRRPLRPQSLMGALPQNEGINALSDGCAGPSALEERTNLQLAGERKALYTDVDYNGHVNNVRYIQWIEDAVGAQGCPLRLPVMENAGKMRLDINYLNEILFGEVVEILFAPINNEKGAFAFEGRKKESCQAAFRAELRLL